MVHEALPELEYRFDADLLSRVPTSGVSQVRVYRFPETAVVLGRGSRADRDLVLPAVLADRVPVYRRMGGGCPVVLDRGNVIVSMALPAPGIGRVRELTALATEALVAALARVGYEGLSTAGVCDIVRGDRKVCGACSYRARGIYFYSASLLVAPDLSLLDRYLRHPPREPDYRCGRAHQDFVEALGGTLDPADLMAALDLELRSAGGGWGPQH